MSVHIDLLVPSFSFPLSHSDCTTTSSSSSSSSDGFILNDNTIQFLHSQCINAFGVDKGELELFQLFNNQNEIRVGCLINGYKINLDTIYHTMQQNKTLNELLSKTTDAMLHLQQQRDRDIAQLLEKTSELAELKVANIELQNEIKTMQTHQTKQQQQILQLQQHNQLLIDNKHPEGTRLYHLLDDNNNNTGKHSGSKFMDRLLGGSHTINTNTSSITSNLSNMHISHTSNSLAASAPATSSAIHLSPAPHSSSFSSSPPNPNPPNPATPVVYNSPLIPPALDLGDSPSNPSSSVNNEMVADNLRKKLISFARDGPYYAYSNSNSNVNSSNNINNSNLPRPSTGSRPSPPAGPKPHLSPRMGRVLSRSTFQFDADQTNGKDEIPFPFPFPFPPAANPSSRASTPKNIRGSTPSNRSSSSSPRRASYADPPPQYHHPLQSSIRSPSPPRPPSSASSHDHLIVTPLRGSSSKYT